MCGYRFDSDTCVCDLLGRNMSESSYFDLIEGFWTNFC